MNINKVSNLLDALKYIIEESQHYPENSKEIA